jgi:hypothetical protein
VTHTYNASYSRSRDLEDQVSKPVQIKKQTNKQKKQPETLSEK